MSRPSVAAVVVTWNSAGEIERCLRTAVAQEGVDLRIVVVDNGSQDGTTHLLARWADRVQVIENPRNEGYAAANNAGWEAVGAAADYVLLLNPDCYPDPGCVAALVRLLETEPSVGVAAALLRNADGSPQLFARRLPTLPIAWWCLTETGSRLDDRFFGGAHRRHRVYAEEFSGGKPRSSPRTVDTAAAACVLLRARDLPRPLLDERFPLLYNDTDLYQALRSRGLSCVVTPAATAEHGHGTSLIRLPEPRYRAAGLRGLLRYADKWWSLPARLLLRVLLVADALGCLLFAVRRHKRDRALVGLRAALGALGLPGGAPPWLG